MSRIIVNRPVFIPGAHWLLIHFNFCTSIIHLTEKVDVIVAIEEVIVPGIHINGLFLSSSENLKTRCI